MSSLLDRSHESFNSLSQEGEEPRLDETEALVECGFAEDKDGTIACAPAMINAAPYQFAADAPALVSWQHGEWCKSHRVHGGVLRFDGESAESDVPDNLLFRDGNQRCDQSIGLTETFNESCLAGLPEGHLDDMPDSCDILGGLCADCDH